MDNPRALERALRNYAHRACVDNGIKCQIAGKPAIAPDTLFSDFWFRTGTTKLVVEKGEQRELTVGLIQFTLHEPADYDHGRTIAIAEAISRYYTRKWWPVPPRGHVQTHKMGIVKLPRSQTRKRVVVIVDGSFEYLHPAPAPTFFAL